MSKPVVSLQNVSPLRRDEHGAVMVEFALILGLLLTMIMGFLDFSMVLYQWNAASKAVERGARLAAVSNPVVTQISTLSGVGGGVTPGDPMPAFQATCTGTATSCTVTTCTGALTACTADAAAFNVIVKGRDSTCGTIGTDAVAGMCDLFYGITPANVIVSYTNAATSGLGFAGRPGGATATVTVQVTGLTFNLFFLNAILGFSPITMPSMSTTVTGEDLSSTAN